MTRWLAALPLALMLILGLIGVFSLRQDPAESVTYPQDRKAPDYVFQPLFEADPSLNFAKLAKGEAILVNVFASWCAPCRIEHPLLMQLARDYPGRLYGVLHKDMPERGSAFLTELGNPYLAVGLDEDGQGGLELGLTGVPETYLISAEGYIILHVKGPLNRAILAEIIARRELD